MGPYTLTPKVSNSYHRLFSERFPPPKCVPYTGLELRPPTPLQRTEKNTKHGKQQEYTIERCQRNVKDLTLFFRKGSPLSNFYPCQFTDPMDGQTYNCSEQYYQAAKADTFGDLESYNFIMQTSNQVHMKQRGEKIKNLDQTDWKRIKRGILKRGVTLKFNQNEDLRRYLLNTREIIAEASPGDLYWGIGRSIWDPRAGNRDTWRGKNIMGEILMEVKRQLGGGGDGEADQIQLPTMTSGVKKRVKDVLKVGRKEAGDAKTLEQDQIIHSPQENKSALTGESGKKTLSDEEEPILELHPQEYGTLSPKSSQGSNKSRNQTQKQSNGRSGIPSPDRGAGDLGRAIQSPTHAAIQSPVYSPSHDIESPTHVPLIQTEMDDELTHDAPSPERDIQSPDDQYELESARIIQTNMDMTPESKSERKSEMRTGMNQLEADKEKLKKMASYMSRGKSPLMNQSGAEKEKLKKMAPYLGSKAVREGEKAGGQASALSHSLQKPVQVSDNRTVQLGTENASAEVGSQKKRTVVLRRPAQIAEENRQEYDTLPATGFEGDLRKVQVRPDTKKGPAGVFAKALSEVVKKPVVGKSVDTSTDTFEEGEVLDVSLEEQKSDTGTEGQSTTFSEKAPEPPVAAIKQNIPSKPFLFPSVAPLYSGSAETTKMPVFSTEKAGTKSDPKQTGAIPKRKIQIKRNIELPEIPLPPSEPDALGGGDNELNRQKMDASSNQMQNQIQTQKDDEEIKDDDDEFDEFLKERVEMELETQKDEDGVALNEPEQEESMVSNSDLTSPDKKKAKKKKKDKKHKKKKKKKKHRDSDRDSDDSDRKGHGSESDDSRGSKHDKYSDSEGQSPEKDRRHSDVVKENEHHRSRERSADPPEKKRRRFKENPSPKRQRTPSPKRPQKRPEDMSEEELLIMLNTGGLEPDSPPPPRRRFKRGFRGRGRWSNRGRRGRSYQWNNPGRFSRANRRSRSRSRSGSRSRSSSYSRSRSRGKSSSTSRSRSGSRSKRQRRHRSSSSDRSSRSRGRSHSSGRSSNSGHRKKGKGNNLPLAYKIANERDRERRSRSWSYSKSRARSDSRERSKSKEKNRSPIYADRGGRNRFGRNFAGAGRRVNRGVALNPDPDNPLAKAHLCERNIQRFTFFFRKGSPLSNAYVCSFRDKDGQTYNSSEQYYHYHRAKILGDNQMARSIIQTIDLALIRQCGENVQGYTESVHTFEGKHARRVMAEGIELKFRQNPILRDHLMQTNDVIAEANNRDVYFSIGLSMYHPTVTQRATWIGENVLGEILMDLKYKFKEEGY